VHTQMLQCEAAAHGAYQDMPVEQLLFHKAQ